MDITNRENTAADINISTSMITDMGMMGEKKWCFMIDLHAHYLPEMDDGAKNAAESLEMLKNSFFTRGKRVCRYAAFCDSL